MMIKQGSVCASHSAKVWELNRETPNMLIYRAFVFWSKQKISSRKKNSATLGKLWSFLDLSGVFHTFAEWLALSVPFFSR